MLQEKQAAWLPRKSRKNYLIFNLIESEKMKVVIRTTKDMTQKKAFEKLIPYLYVLRKKNCSWAQITDLLNEKCGFNLQSGTVRTYFGEMAKKHADICQSAMEKYIFDATKKKRKE